DVAATTIGDVGTVSVGALVSILTVAVLAEPLLPTALPPLLPRQVIVLTPSADTLTMPVMVAVPPPAVLTTGIDIELSVQLIEDTPVPLASLAVTVTGMLPLLPARFAGLK